MAVTKEAMVIVLDVGHSMKEIKEGGSVLEQAKTCVNLIIQRKIFSESKDEISVILFGTEDTCNSLDEDPDFKNIKVVQDFKTAEWQLLEFVDEIKSSHVNSDDMKDNAMILALHSLQNIANSKKFFSRRILFLSRFDSPFCNSKYDEICDRLKNSKIDLDVIGPSTFSSDVKNGSLQDAFADVSNNMFHSILKEVNGEFHSFSEAIPALIYYQKKKVQALPWNADLDIGTNLSIPISAYTKVNQSKAKSWKSAYARKLNAKIERNTSFLLNDEAQTRVSSDGIISAFKYGTTLVPFTAEDKQNMDYQSGEKGMKVLGFTKRENIQRYHFLGDKSAYVFGQKNRELAGVILAPFIHALHDLNMVAIVRYVYSARSAPKMGFLMPKVKSNYECLVFVTLPFMEDLRHYVFSPLDADSKNIPTDDQLNAVDDLISSMDLSTAAIDDEGNIGEAMKPKYTINPFLQRLYQCLQHRALHSEKPLPELSPHILEIINPPRKLLKMAEPAIDKLKELFPLRDVKQAVKTKATNIFSLEPDRKRPRLEEADNPALFDAVGDDISSVGSVDPVKDFRFLMGSKKLKFSEACKQITDVVWKYIFTNESNLKHYHTKIIDICREIRSSALKEKDASLYNAFMKTLKSDLASRDVDLWNGIRNEGIGLLSTEEVEFSSVSPEEATNFLSALTVKLNSSTLQESAVQPEEEEDDMDLLDQL